MTTVRAEVSKPASKPFDATGRTEIAKLETFARKLFTAACMDADKAATMAELLVLTDALGRRTHGLAMLPLYLAEIAKGTMSTSGEPEVISERGVVALWDGHYLPGQWMIARADHGHKGFGLALMVEALSQGLAGHGRADAPTRWGGNTFVQLIDPALFAGRDDFARLMDHFGERCRANKPIDAAQPVRLPGDSAARHLASARANGIVYDDATWSALAVCAREHAIELPEETTK